MAYHKFEGNRIEVRYKGGGDQSSETSPWEGQQPYLRDLFQRANQQSWNPVKFFPGSTIAGFTPEQLQAQQQASARAMAGSPIQSLGKDQYLATMRGDYLNPDTNPWLKQTYNRALETAAPPIDAAATQAGRYGSGAWGQMRGRTQADLATGIYGQNYQTERDRQNQAVFGAPQYAANDYNDIANLAAVGAEKQQMNQALINEARQRWEFKRNEPWDRLFNYRNLITGDFGGNVSSSGGGGKG